MKTLLKKLFAFFSSFGLAASIFIFFFFLILFGTLYQVDNGLFEAQQKYFNSMYVIHHIGPIAFPLPGGYLLTALLAVNLICGGLIRIRKNIRRPGVIITHIGILILILSAAVTYHFSDRGHMRLYPGDESNVYQSYNDWVIQVGKPASGATLQIIQDTQIANLNAGESRTFYSDDIPIEITLHGYAQNATPVPVQDGATGPEIVDGFRLQALPPEQESEMNVPGAYVTATDKATGEKTQGLLWGLSMEPFTVQSGDVYYTIGFARKSYRTPFVIHVDDFRRRVHAGTNMDASFEADVTKFEDGTEESMTIWMNHPLRRRGYTFFQTSWGPSNARPGEPLFTVFEVVRNPADQGPLVACIIISIGFLIHFIQKLAAYMRAEARRRTT